jgi:hypothetical protein
MGSAIPATAALRPVQRVIIESDDDDWRFVGIVRVVLGNGSVGVHGPLVGAPGWEVHHHCWVGRFLTTVEDDVANRKFVIAVHDV